MTCDALQVANWFVKRFSVDERHPSVMELIKLTYIAHGWHLEMYNEPLFTNRIEAWQYGPVIPDVYHAFRSQGIHVSRQAPGVQVIVDERAIGLLEQVYNLYGNYTAFQLSDLTHITGGPWDVTMKIGGQFALIPDSVIKHHYQNKRVLESKLGAN